MDYWVFLLGIPIVNFGVMLYLGFNGNRLAFEKSDFDSPNDFLKVQAEWSKWGFRAFWIILLYPIFWIVTY